MFVLHSIFDNNGIIGHLPIVDKVERCSYNNADSHNLKGGTDMANEMGKRYMCTKCGTELIVTRAGNGAVGCCGQPMEKK
ncbi:MAG: hypothetical protein SVO26_05830 [Chloroflexota bacterium]|nr:hypothetical protein [Chloroflexota bacterium]